MARVILTTFFFLNIAVGSASWAVPASAFEACEKNKIHGMQACREKTSGLDFVSCRDSVKREHDNCI